jgi:hypothetical protein
MGELLERQSLAHRDAVGHAALAAEHAGLADDLVNFHWDPVTAAVAVGWPGATTSRRGLRISVDAAGVLQMREDPAGVAVDVVDHVNGASFTSWWLRSVETAHARTG